MEALTDRNRPVNDRFNEHACHISGMDVLEGLHAKVRQRHLVAISKILEYTEIQIARRVDGYPARTGDVTRMDHGRWHPAAARLAQQVQLDRRLGDSVLTQGPPR